MILVGKLLGFPASVLNEGYHKSPKIIDISEIIYILIHVDILSGSFLKGSNAQIIYTFASAVKPGTKMIESPSPHEYMPISQSMIYSVRIWLTDQNLRLINNRREMLVVRLSIRQIINIEESFINAMNKMKE